MSTAPRRLEPGLQGVTPSAFNLPVGGWYLEADEMTLILWWLGDLPELLNRETGSSSIVTWSEGGVEVFLENAPIETQ